MSFASLGLSEPLVRAVHDHGYTEPTPIQAQGIPVVLAGGDLIACAQTGTGKTAAFTLPILERLGRSQPERAGGRWPVRALVLTPTRELAAQVEESVRTYGRHSNLSSLTVFGGVGMQPQVQRLRGRVDILVATPGRLLDHTRNRTADLSKVEILVLDEADRMLDMGFIPDIRRILTLLPKQRQNLLFSATFSDEIRELARGMMNSPTTVEVARRNAPAERVDQKVVMTDKGAKRGMLSHLIRRGNWDQVLVFTRTKHGANRLAEQLDKDGIAALAIHGNKSQSARTQALGAFKAGKLRVLVATDIAARGLDIADLPHVVNYELPNVPEDYVHRIGRTGRAGADGEAVSLVGGDERPLLGAIEKLLGRKIERLAVPDFDPAAYPRTESSGDEYRGQARHAPPRRAPAVPAAGARRERPASQAPGRTGAAPESPQRPAAPARAKRPAFAGAAPSGARGRPGTETARGDSRRPAKPARHGAKPATAPADTGAGRGAPQPQQAAADGQRGHGLKGALANAFGVLRRFG